jgi:hypothetical protein
MQNPSKEHFIAQVRAGGRLSASVLDSSIEKYVPGVAHRTTTKGFPSKGTTTIPPTPLKKKKRRGEGWTAKTPPNVHCTHLFPSVESRQAKGDMMTYVSISLKTFPSQ